MLFFKTLKGKFILMGLLSLILLCFGVPEVIAQTSTDTFGLNQVDQTVELANEDIRIVIARVIRVALSLLGIIAVAIILYGGFVYMTSGGSEDKVATARKIIINGVIGLTIILSSLAITQFVISRLSAAVTGVEPGDGGEEGVNPNCFDPVFFEQNRILCTPGEDLTCEDLHFVVRSLTPSTGNVDPVEMNNIVVRAVFSRPISQDTDLANAITLEHNGSDIDVSTELKEGRFVLESIVDADTFCSDNQNCLEEGQFSIFVDSSIQSSDGDNLEEETDCGTYPQEATFVVDSNDVVDLVGPDFSEGGVKINNQFGGNVVLPRGTTYPIQVGIVDTNGQENEDAGVGGVAYAKMLIYGEDEGRNNPIRTFYTGPKTQDGSSGEFSFDHGFYIPRTFEPLKHYIVEITSYDVDHQSSVIESSFTIVGENCDRFGNPLNEEAVDECLSGDDNGCTADWQCQSQVCDEELGQCVPQPMIVDADPWNGATSGWVTVLGQYFGNSVGTIEFGADSNDDGIIDENDTWIQANLPQQCGNTWHDDYIIVEVPDAFGDDSSLFDTGLEAAIRVTRSDDQTLFDSSVDNHGPRPGPQSGKFLKNEINRPGLCLVETASGETASLPGATVRVIGNDFSEVTQENAIDFGGVFATISDNNQTLINTLVPDNLRPGKLGVRVTTNGQSSNGVPFTILGDEDTDLSPIIEQIDPSIVTPGSFITISGARFGSQPGFVYLGTSAEQVQDCAQNRNQDNVCIALVLDIPGCGGQTWRDSQIVAAIPDNVIAAEYAILVQRGDTAISSDGNSLLTVENGDPLPSLCSVSPAIGPAPLPSDSTGLILSGANFSDESVVYFWRRNANANDFSTWLSSDNPNVVVPPDNRNVIDEVTETKITAYIPTLDGVSMDTGPIRVAVGNQISNPVQYEVLDCRQGGESPGENFQCCQEGAEAGQWKPSEYICAGETRSAGYVWRFTTGKIPKIPDVIEACSIDEWSSNDPQVPLPSPSPWDTWDRAGTGSCINSRVSVRFTTNMSDNSLRAPGQVSVYSCGKGSEPDCSNKQPVNINIPNGLPSDVLFIDPIGGEFSTGTWFQVELGDQITSQETEIVLGEPVVQNIPLLTKRPCGDGTAYCFQFKTNSRTCTLAAAGIQPPSYVAHTLGLLQDPRFNFDPQDPFAHPLYYYVWGRGDQQCIVLDVDDNNWQWNPAKGNDSRGFIEKSPDEEFVNSRALVTALQHTAPESIILSAQTNIQQENDQGEIVSSQIRGESELIIDLADPKVTEFWPNCTEACGNATIGVVFNRFMMVSTYNGGVRFQKCTTETCDSVDPTDIPLNIIEGNDPFMLRMRPGALLDPGAWYLVTVTDQIRALEQLEPPIAGNPVEEFSWKFRAKTGEAFCEAERVRIQPDPFTARQIGEKTVYNVFPHGSPDSCNPRGQELDPWSYGWNWNAELVDNQKVAEVTTFSTIGEIDNQCTLSCLSKGSQVLRGEDSANLCGNSRVDVGEDCDININGEVIGESCSLNCLRPGSSAPDCGDGITDPLKGEECDPADPETQNGCDPSICLHTGSVTTPPEGDVDASWCGSGEVTNGEDCDIALDGTRCSQSCLNLGTNLSSSWCNENPNVEQCGENPTVCGNFIVEPGEECEIIRPLPTIAVVRYANGTSDVVFAPASGDELICNSQCLIVNACELPNAPDSVKCDPAEEGCSQNCTYTGSSVSYNVPSLCGDGVVGLGEQSFCEPIQANPNAVGQNPVQLVTAIGDAPADPDTKTQSTNIVVSANQVLKPGTLENPNSSIEPLTNPISGSGLYRLQCGYIEYEEPDQNGRINNCPVATDGVAENSCCYPRPQRVDSYPIDMAGIRPDTDLTCRNTIISVTFNDLIDNTSLPNNLLIAQGFEEEVSCTDLGLVDVSEDVASSLANAEGYIPHTKPKSFFAKIWNSITKFFGKIFSTNAHASVANVSNIRTWCSGAISAIPEVQTISVDNGYETTVRLPITQLLEANATYAVIFKGGNTGIRQINGVGIGNPDNLSVIDDSIVFRTGNDICKINSVSIDPANQLFTEPNQIAQFSAVAESTNGQLITPIENVYDWTWNWLPQNSDIFTIPSPPSEPTEATIEIAAKTVPGVETGIAQALVVSDVDEQNNDIGKRYSGTTELSAFFCERPWPIKDVFPYEDGNPPGRDFNNDSYNTDTNIFDGLPLPRANGEYFNISFGYCADSGQVDNTADDLPFLRPFIFSPTIDDADKQCVKGDLIGQSCSADDECYIQFSEGQDLSGSCVTPTTLPDNVLKRWIMFNDKNEDVIGVQIFNNRNRLPAAAWYQEQGTRDIRFQNLSDFNTISVDGYNAIADENNYYISALSKTDDDRVNSYVYHFSINEGAQNDTKVVFNSILDSLKFNINISDHGLCLAENSVLDEPAFTHLIDVPDEILSQVTEISCSSNFDCMNDSGAPLEGTQGVCSNSRTAFLRDWKRVNDIKEVQDRLEVYVSENEGQYPTLESGTFVPKYTNSRWPSWSRLSGLLGRAPIDPLNEWTSCGICTGDQGKFCTVDSQCGEGDTCEIQSSQTCWSVQNSQYICPAESLTYEYEYDENLPFRYVFHAPLEYFNENTNAVRDLVDENHFSSDRWCQPELIVNPFAAQCGDGIVNRETEQCDPPGTIVQSDLGYINIPAGTCDFELEQRQCSSSADCIATISGNGFQINHSPDTKVCNFKNVPLFDREVGGEADIYLCNADSDCRNLNTYSRGQNVNEVDVFYRENTQRVDSLKLDQNELSFEPERFTCDDAESFFYQDSDDLTCFTDENNQVLAECSSDERASAYCNNDCELVYSTCDASFSCGNGVIEPGEVCDDGTRNGTYGQCNSDCSAPFAEFCGDGIVNNQENYGSCIIAAGVCSQNSQISCTDDSDCVVGAALEVCDIGDTALVSQGFCETNRENVCSNDSDCTYQTSGECVLDGEAQGPQCPSYYPNDTWDRSCVADSACWHSARFDNLPESTKQNLNNNTEFNSDLPSVCTYGAAIIYDKDALANFGRLHAFGCSQDSECLNIATYGERSQNGYNGGITFAPHEDPFPLPVWEHTISSNEFSNLLNDDGGLFNCATFESLPDFSGPSETDICEGNPNVGSTYCSNDPSVGCDIGNRDADGNHIDCQNLDISDACLATDTALYHISPDFSCAQSCLATGGYCGDGILQSDYEDCDDGNVLEDDGCSSVCLFDETPLVQDEEVVVQGCGDGIVQDSRGEVCDLGDQNGISCNPSYAQSCVFCSADCRETLSVDPQAFCGNEQVDVISGDLFNIQGRGLVLEGQIEACDLDRQGNLVTQQVCDNDPTIACQSDGECGSNGICTLVNPTPLSCIDKGQYSCVSECSDVTQNCVTCVPKEVGPEPRITVINPMFDTWAPNRLEWQNIFAIRLRRDHENSNLAWGGELNDFVYNLVVDQEDVDSYIDEHLTLKLRDTVETNNMCNGEYDLEIAVADALAGFGSSRDGVRFSYPVAAESFSVDNELIVSPALPTTTYRFVLRWTGEEQDSGGAFSMKVYNSNFSEPNVSRMVGFPMPDVGEEPIYAVEASLNNSDYTNYWWPINSVRHQEHVYVHYQHETDKNILHAITLETEPAEARRNGRINLDSTFAVFVSTLNGRPITEYQLSNLALDVYVEHDGQDSTNSYFHPEYTFNINAALHSTNPSALYWHAFNVVKNPDTDKYEIAPIIENSRVYNNGTIETGFQDLKCNVPGEFCNRFDQ